MKLVSNEEKKIRSSTGQKNEKKITYADIIFNDTRLIQLSYIPVFLKMLSDICSFKVVCVKNVILCLSRLSHKMLHNQNKKGPDEANCLQYKYLRSCLQTFQCPPIGIPQIQYILFHFRIHTKLISYFLISISKKKNKTEFCKYCCIKKIRDIVSSLMYKLQLINF